MPDRSRLSPAWACEDDARRALVQTAPARLPGLGSVSVRWRRSGADGFLIAPRAAGAPAVSRAASAPPGTSAQPAGLSSAPDGVVWIALQAASPGSDPASAAPFESALHRRLYRHRADVAAIVQSRPTFCTALACVARVQEAGIPAFHPDLVVAAGGALRCAAGPATAAPDAGGQSDPGTDAAGFELIALALADRNACLLASRGLLTAGATLQLAMQRAEEIEALAQIYLRVLLLDGARG